MSELWKLHVHNAAHDILHDLQTLQVTFRELAGDKSVLLDSFCVADRQIALMRSEATRLTEYIGRLPEPTSGEQK